MGSDQWHDMPHALREIEAMRLGRAADHSFRARCYRLGINAQEALSDPLLAIAIARQEAMERVLQARTSQDRRNGK